MNAAIELQAVSYRYPGTVFGVTGLDLQVARGELVAIIGPSGCGKTTLLNLVAGFLSPDTGDIRIAGTPAANLAPARREVGIVFQNYALFPHMTALNNVAYPLRVRGVSRLERRRGATEMLQRVGLGTKLASRPAELSGGQQQRVALARALVFKPRALLLDEPLSALDASLRIGMRDEIRRLQREHGIATLHITHDQEEALSMADRVAVMRDGRLLQIGTPKEIYDRPIDAGVASFVGQANLWPARVRDATIVESAIGELQVGPGHGFAPGASVMAMVRPERVVPAAAPEGTNEFHGRVVQDRFLGSVRRYDFATDRGVIVGETATSGPSQVIHLPPTAVRLLQPVSNQSVTNRT